MWEAFFLLGTEVHPRIALVVDLDLGAIAEILVIAARAEQVRRLAPSSRDRPILDLPLRPAVPSAVVQPLKVLPSKSETQPSSSPAAKGIIPRRMNPTIPEVANFCSRFMDRQPPMLARGRAGKSMSITLVRFVKSAAHGQALIDRPAGERRRPWFGGRAPVLRGLVPAVETASLSEEKTCRQRSVATKSFENLKSREPLESKTTIGSRLCAV